MAWQQGRGRDACVKVNRHDECTAKSKFHVYKTLAWWLYAWLPSTNNKSSLPKPSSN